MGVYALNISGTVSTPEIVGDWDAGVLSMSGDSYPENRNQLFGPVIDWVQSFLSESDRPLRLDLRLIYLNTSSIKGVMDILDLFGDAHDGGRLVEVNWYFDVKNERLAELAEEFKEGCLFPFHILAFEG